MITQLELNSALDNAIWNEAKSMPKIPHSYTIRKNWSDDKLFVECVKLIRLIGVKEKFYSKEYIYYYYNGFKYWTMGNPVSYTDKKKTFILNRAKA